MMPSGKLDLESGCLYVVATPIGHLNDFSQRGYQVLQGVDSIICENRPKALGFLSHLGIKKSLISMNAGNESHQVNAVIQQLKQAKSIAIITDAGTPAISDPGYILVKACHEHQIKVIPIPGACALTTALSASGIPSTEFVFVGFLPRTQSLRLKQLNYWAGVVKTIVFYESAKRLHGTLTDCLAVYGSEARVCVARELTKLHEQIVTMYLGDYIAQQADDVKGECVLMLSHQASEKEQLNSQDRHMMSVLLAHHGLGQAASLCAQISNKRRALFYAFGKALKDGQ